jgi:hypothetical protein
MDAELNVAQQPGQNPQAAPAAGQPDSLSSQQIQGGDRGLEFNPSNDPASSVGAGQEADAAGSSGVAGLAGQPQGTEGGEWESVVDVARSLGYDFGGQQFSDDRQFVLHLLNTATNRRQEDYYAQLGRQLAPHHQGIQSYLQQQQGQQASRPQQQQRPEWEPPEFDPSWMQLVERDAQSGVFLARPGVDPSIATAVNQYDRWHQKYGHNPVAAMQPYIEQSLPAIVQQQVQAQLQQYRQQQEVDSIVARNSEWMYQRDQQGRTMIGVGGRPLPTPQGARYGQIVQELEQNGMRSPAAVDRIARQVLAGEMAQQQSAAGQPLPTQQQQQNALASSRSQRNVLQSLTPQQRQQTPAATEPNTEGMSLNEMLRNALDSAGFTDADFQDMDAMRA